MRRDVVETDEIPLLLVRLIYCESGIETQVIAVIFECIRFV